MSSSKGAIIPQERVKRYGGEYLSQVVSTSDPQKLMRVRVRVMGLFEGAPDSDLPWAEYRFPVGTRPGNGYFVPAEVGDWVWVDFPHSGDTRRPRITGGAHFAPGGVPNLSPDAFAGAGGIAHSRTAEEPSPPAAAYHRDVVAEDGGMVIEVIKGGNGAIVITQRATGTAVEICQNGDITLHGSVNVHVSGQAKLNVVAPVMEFTAATSITMSTPAFNLEALGGGGGNSGTFNVDTMVINTSSLDINQA